jgi:hypothetical protein
MLFGLIVKVGISLHRSEILLLQPAQIPQTGPIQKFAIFS